jgi:hypothetical protein
MLIIRLCFPFFDFNGPFRAVSYAGTKTVAEQIAYKPCLAINKLQRPFMGSQVCRGRKPLPFFLIIFIIFLFIFLLLFFYQLFSA